MILNTIKTYLSPARKHFKDGNILNWYEHLKRTFIKECKRFAIGHNNNIKNIILNLQEDIEALESVTTPQKDIIEALNYKLNDYIKIQEETSSLKSKTTSADISERTTKEWFRQFKPHKTQNTMTSLKEQDDSIVRTQDGMIERACNFFEKLYSLGTIDKDKMNSLLLVINKKINANTFEELNRPFTISEVEDAIKNLATCKAPGPDGLGNEFYKFFSNNLSKILTDVFNECIRKESLPESMTAAKIILLYKKGDPQQLNNWRPISLLNSDYKIFAKIITTRMSKYLPNIINQDQKGFVPSRKLDDAILKVTHIINYCKRSNTPAYLMFLDQEKAFDRVDRNYMHKIIETFNFPPLIRSAIKAMYNNTSANITINGQISRNINLLSGVRQGCPLSPTIYALCIEALGCHIRQNPRYKGLTIPGAGTYKVCNYADDTTFVISQPEDLDAARESLNIFTAGTNAKENVLKREILPIGPNTHSRCNPLITNYKILAYDADVRFLGINIGNNVNINNIWEEKIRSLENSCAIWNQKQLTLDGKVIALKQQALSSIMFQAKFHQLTDIAIKKIDKTIHSFINNGKTKSPIKYEILKLHKEQGGIYLPDIKLMYKISRAKWIKELMNPNITSEWKQLANLEIDIIAKRHNMGINILQYPKLLTRNQGFWYIALTSFFQLGGVYTPNFNINNYTPQRLLNEPLSTFMDNKKLNEKISNTHQIIRTFSETGAPIPTSPKSIKQQNQQPRLILKRTYEKLQSAIPDKTLPPDYVDDLGENRSPKIAKIIKIEDDVLVRQNFKRIKEDHFAPTGSPLRPYTRDINLELNEVIVREIPNGSICRLDTIPSGPKFKLLQTAGFKLEDIFMPIMNIKWKILYKETISQREKSHQHASIFSNILIEAEEWRLLPNKKLHPSIPIKVKDFRFLAIHNRLNLGRQLAHIPNIEPNKLFCPFCPEQTNDLQHLMLLCPNALDLWSHIETFWQGITGTYEDFIDIQLELDYKTKIFGILTPKKPNSPSQKNKNNFIMLITLDILVGNAQFTLIKQHKTFLRTNQAPPESETIFIFEQHMTDSMNKIITRMRKKPYDHRWLFSKPKILPKSITRTNWKVFIIELLQLSLKSEDDVLPNNINLELTLSSQLDSEQEEDTHSFNNNNQYTNNKITSSSLLDPTLEEHFESWDRSKVGQKRRHGRE